MNVLNLPKELRIFTGDFQLIEGDAGSANGFGRIWIRPIGNQLPQEFVLKLGSDVLRIRATTQTVGTNLFGFAAADKGWLANVSHDKNGIITLSLYGVGYTHKSVGLDLQFKTSIEGVNDNSFDESCRIFDAWSARDLLFLRYDSDRNIVFLVGDKQVGRVSISDGVPEIVSLHPLDYLGQNLGRWVLLDSEPLHVATEHWDEPSAMILQGLDNSISDFMKAWKEYNDAEEKEVEELRARIGVLQYGKKEIIKGNYDSELIKISINQTGSSGESLAFLKERVEGRGTVVVEVSEQKPVGDANDRDSSNGNNRAEVDFVDIANSVIHLRVPIGNLEIPGSGFVFVSVAGDLAQINRRRSAENRFANGECEIKGLSEILREVTPLESRSRKHEVGVSAKMRAQFSGELTPRQITAIEIAVNTPDIALIQGPPGTGKTQVIALIEQRIAELELNGRQNTLILLTSTQNDAVDQVAARTRIFGLPPNRDVGRGDIDPIEVWRKERLTASYALLDSDNAHNKVVNVSNIVSKIVTDHFYSDEQLDVLTQLETFVVEDHIRQMLADARQEIELNQLKKSLRERIERRIRALRTASVSYEDDGRERLLDIQREIEAPELPKKWRNEFGSSIAGILSKEENAWKECLVLQEELLDLFFDTVDLRPKRFSEDIRILARKIKTSVEKKTHQKKPGAVVSIGEALELYVNEISSSDNVDTIVREYSVVHAATCQRSARSWEGNDGRGASVGFQNVIVDEAARVNPSDLLIPLVQAKQRVILVGDHRQLPTVFDDHIAHGVSEAELLNTSLFERLFLMLQRVGRETGIPRTITLNTQYRMHPRLGDFVSREFYEPYGESIESGLTEEHFRHQIDGFANRTSVWVDVPLGSGAAQRSVTRSWYRESEASEVARIASKIVRENPDISVGIITFYSAQKELILELLDDELVARDEFGSPRVSDAFALQVDDAGKVHERLRVGSVDAFQGKEFDVVILSIVRSQKIRSTDTAVALFGFATIENRMCVALSRQKKLLIVVGDKSMASSEPAGEITGMHSLVQLCDEEEELLPVRLNV